MNAEETAFADNSFDLICETEIFHHFNLNKACAEIRRILRPDACAVFIELLGHNPLVNLYRKLTPQIRSVDKHSLLVKDVSDIREQFVQVDCGISFFVPGCGAVPQVEIFPVAIDTLQRGNNSLFRMLPATWRYVWMMVMVVPG
jgi:SAM-dependent methyltransferase